MKWPNRGWATVVLVSGGAGIWTSAGLGRLAGITSMCCALLLSAQARADFVIPPGSFMALAGSNTGKTWQFASGSTQTVQHLLNIQGTTPDPLQFRGTVPGQTAFIALTGAQSIAHIGVTDVWATAVWLAPYQTNEGGGGNANRWFGVPDYARIPTLNSVGLLVLLLLLSAAVTRTWSQRRRQK